MYRSYLLVACLAFATTPLLSQNVGIGTANPLERLHVAGNLRVNGLAGVGNRVVGTDLNGTLIVFGAGTNNQVLTQTAAGPAWQAASNDWAVLGNAGTNPATNFAGTTDNQAFAIRTNNTERARVMADGRMVVNSTTPVAGDIFSAYGAGLTYAVNGYMTGTGAAGYFMESGGGNAVTGISSSATGVAAEFTTTAASSGATVDIYSAASTTPTVFVRADGNSAANDALEIDVNGAAAKRGLDVYLDVAGSGIGIAVFTDGTGRSANFQNQNTASTNVAVFAQHAGNGRVLNAQGTSTTHSTQIGFFSQASTGTATATFGNAAAVWGQSQGIRGGVFLAAGGSTNTTVLQGAYSGAAGNFDGVGVYGSFAPNPNWGYGVVGVGNWYGVYSNGIFGGTGAKSFQIDHPLDPENKYLRHYSLESPEVLNLYRGNVVLDASGEAVVEMPDYFHEVNIDFSYNLTPIGAPANLYVKSEIDQSGKFSIAGGNPGMKVSWYVYAQRNDLYTRTYPDQVKVEVEKRPHEKGLYLRPEIYGQPAEKGIFHRFDVNSEKVTVEQGLTPDSKPEGGRVRGATLKEAPKN